MRMREIFEGKTVKAAAPKPRNFVAKNAAATTSGAGAHKDKKKAAKQGVVKHKSKEIAEGKLDEVLNPTSVISKALRYLGRKFATAFPYIVTGGAGAGLVASGLMAPLIASVGGATAFITSLSAEAALMGGAVGMAGAPSIIQVIKDLFAADENSIQAGIKRWVEKHVGDESDVSEFLALHAKNAFTGKSQFRWRANVWPVKMSTSDAEAYLEKHDKSWLDAEKEKQAGSAKQPEQGVAEGAVKELSSDLRTMTDAEFQARYKMSKAEARAGLRGKRESRSFFADPVMEKAVSTAQQKLMGMVHAAKKGAKPASKEVAKIAKGMSKKAAKDYASTKHKGLPKHVDETATAGATSAGNVGVGVVYKNKKPKMQKPGTNALDSDNLMTGGSIVKR